MSSSRMTRRSSPFSRSYYAAEMITTEWLAVLGDDHRIGERLLPITAEVFLRFGGADDRHRILRENG
jgi:hypothetical protein